MKNVILGLSILTLFSLMLTACSDSALDVSSAQTENSLQHVATQNQGNNSVVSLVRGSGHFRINGELRSFSFTAHEKADGSVDGNWQFFSRVSDFQANGKITCMEVHDGVTYLGGFMRKGDLSSEPNNEIGFRVVDNGEGKNAPADQVSLMFVGAGDGFANTYCSGAFIAPILNDVESGNIQVK